MSNFRKIRGRYRYLETNYPKVAIKTTQIISRVAIFHYLKGFDKSGHMTNRSRGGWRPRATYQGNHKLLVKSGRLFRSVRIRRLRRNSILIGTTGVPYAARHNDGLKNMPQREMVGNSDELDKKIIKIIDKQILKNL